MAKKNILSFFKERKPSFAFIIVLLFAIAVVFILNYLFYLKMNKSQKENIQEKVLGEEVDYEAIEKTLTAPFGSSNKLSDEELEKITAPNSVKASEKVLNSLTAPR